MSQFPKAAFDIFTSRSGWPEYRRQYAIKKCVKYKPVTLGLAIVRWGAEGDGQYLWYDAIRQSNIYLIWNDR